MRPCVRKRWTIWVGAALAALAAGCDGASGVSGPPPAAPPTETTTIAVLLPADGLAELDVWESDARRQEARTRALADVRRMTPTDPPSAQAEMIKKAVEDGVSAIILMADDPAAVGPAVEQAIKDGVPVVLLDRFVPTTVTPPPPFVHYEDERKSARALVAAAIEDAKKADFPPSGPALIVVNGPADRHSEARAKALRDELKAAGVRVLPDVTFQGYTRDARIPLEDGFLAAPHVAMVFTDEDKGLGAVATFRHSLDRTKRRFVTAGYTAERGTLDLVKYNTCAAQIDRNINEPIPRAFDTALALIRGETVPSDITIPTPLHRSTGVEEEGNYPGFLLNASMGPGSSSMPPQPNLRFKAKP